MAISGCRIYRVIVVRLNLTLTSLGAPDKAFPARSLSACDNRVLLTVGQACIAMEHRTENLFKHGNQKVVVTIGDRITTTGVDGTEYPNVPLQSSTAYTIFLRGFIDPQSRRKKRQSVSPATARAFTTLKEQRNLRERLWQAKALLTRLHLAKQR